MAALVLPLPTEATAEEKRTHVRIDAVPRKTEDHKVFRKMWVYSLIKTNHNQHRRRRQVGKISNWKGSLGHSSF